MPVGLRVKVEEAWRIVDVALKADSPVFEYQPQSWGPKEAERLTPPGGEDYLVSNSGLDSQWESEVTN